ncbi:UNVERIFIED_CONTAM: hypothetical protein K2H54_016668 [Gekko kuhli]
MAALGWAAVATPKVADKLRAPLLAQEDALARLAAATTQALRWPAAAREQQYGRKLRVFWVGLGSRRSTALRDNFTSLEAEERSQTEAIKNLQQQLAEKSKQLNDEQRKSQEEREHHQAEIQQLREQIAQEQQGNSDGAHGAADLAGLSVTLLTILVAGFLIV